MAYLIDSYKNSQTQIDGKWFIARPLKGPFINRIKDAWKVLTGKCDAVYFYKQ